ncbi:MAG: polyhydroxyalkanoate synthesis regulator DNA-binding domain-containing protein [Salinibacter sp.]
MARRIKRYDNRKLYDTETSEYVSLSDIADFVRRGETVEVVDNATGEDITAQTLTQIILEEGKEGHEVISSDLLHTLLRRSGEVLDSGLDQIRSTVDDLVQSSFGQLKQLVQSPRKHELDELRQQLRRLEHRLSILLDDLDEQRSNSSGFQSYSPEDLDRSASPEPSDRGSRE